MSDTNGTSRPQIEEKFSINVDPGPPMMAIVFLPIQKWIDDRENGAALIHGKLKESEAILLKLMRERRAMKDRGGVIGPDGKPPLSVA